jgi:tetratricopeptide (TPR) repeat protein
MKRSFRFCGCFVVLAGAGYLASGCAGMPDTGATTAIEPQIMPSRPSDDRDSGGVDADTLYKLMVAEIAGQRGDLELSVKNYRELAHSTRDIGVIERAIRIAVFARDDEASADIAQLWLEVEPDNLDAHQVLATVAIRAGEVDQAVQHIATILAEGEGELSQKLWMVANLISREQDQATAMAVMEKVLAQREDDAEAVFAFAHVAIRLDDLERARALLERVMEIDPGNSSAAMSYLSVLQRSGDQQTALAWLEESIDRYAGEFNMRLVYARLLTDARRFDDARQQFEMLLEQAPDNPDVLYALGLLNLQAYRLDDAVVYFERLSTQAQLEQEARYYLGRIAEEQGQYEQAGDYYLGIDAGEHYFDAQVRMALLLAAQDRIDAAREHLQGIEPETDAQQVMLTQAEGEMLVKQKRYEDAMAVYDEALARDTDNHELLYTRALLAEKMDRLDILERDLRRILEQDPDHAQALNALGYTLADRTDRIDEAYDLIKRALELSPDDFYILDSMGWVLYRKGRLDEAVTYLRRALEIRNDPEVAAHLGEVLWVKGDKEGAREIWQSALEATPGDERLLQVIRRFDP